MTKIEIDTFVERMEEIGDVWEAVGRFGTR